MDFIPAIVFGGLALLFLILGLVFTAGRGAWMFQGYHSLTPDEKASFNIRAMLRFEGRCFILAALFMGLAALFSALDNFVLSMVFMGISTAIIAFGSIFVVVSKRFRLAGGSYTRRILWGRSSKVALISGIIVSVAALIGTVILLIVGFNEPNFELSQDSLRITGIYGTTVEFANITDVTLIEQSPRDIGMGMRRNGFGTPNTLRGHFAAGLVFAFAANEGPTIRLNRADGNTIFISLSDAVETRQLYQNIINSMR